VAATLFVSAALVAVAAWQAASLRVGLVVCLGFAVLAVVLVLAGRLLVTLLAPLANARSFPLRHAVLHLSRPGNQTRVILLAVGLGAFFIVGVRSLQASLLAEFSIQVNEESADMFLLDVQRAGQTACARSGDPANGAGRGSCRPCCGASRASATRHHAGELRRSAGPAAPRPPTPSRTGTTSKPTSGSWRAPSARQLARSGSRSREACTSGSPSTSAIVRFDILGRIVNARVSSIRDVDFKDARAGGFMFVFRPGTLEQAPQTCVAPVGAASAGAPGSSDLVSRFPNVSVIDFHEILETVRDVMSKVTLAITVVGFLVLFSGGLILVGAVAMTKFQRVYEAAVFKTLGANTRKIATMLLFEYGVLGSLAGLVGSAGAVALTWGVSRFALDIPWRVFPGEHVVGVALTAALVAAIGVLSSLDVLRNKPLATSAGTRPVQIHCCPCPRGWHECRSQKRQWKFSFSRTRSSESVPRSSGRAASNRCRRRWRTTPARATWRTRRAATTRSTFSSS
jgi:putative ABC transport system permease protein